MHDGAHSSLKPMFSARVRQSERTMQLYLYIICVLHRQTDVFPRRRELLSEPGV